MCDKNTQDAAQWNRAVSAPAAAAVAARAVPASALVKNTKIPQNMTDLVTNANAHLYMDNNVYTASRYPPLVQHATIDSSGKLNTSVTVQGSSGFVAPFPAAISPALEMSTNPYAVDMLKKVKTQQMDYVKKMNSAMDEHHQQAHSSKNETETMDKPLYGVIPNTLADHVLNAISVPPSAQVQASVAPIHGRIFGMGVTKEIDMKSLSSVQQLVESGISDYAKQNISKLLESISALKPLEKLLLYLRLPGDSPEIDPLRQPQNPLGTRSEINHTINWVRTHLEHDPQVSIPKQDVYDDYILYCERLQLKPLSTADFGKVMKQVFPGIRPRRLGTRGHSRYCYAAMRKTANLAQPQLPLLGENTKPLLKAEEVEIQKELRDSQTLDGDENSWQIIQTWSEQFLNVRVKNIQELANVIKTQPQHEMLTMQKKLSAGTLLQRQSKEKQLINDTGPLKKRRKKKRKGSSSSESSTTNLHDKNQEYSGNNKMNILPKNELEKPTTNASLIQMNMLNIKQEVTDFSPTQQQQQHFQLQYQQTPMNLAADKHIFKASTTTKTTTVSPTLSGMSVMQNVPIICSTSGGGSSNLLVPTIKEEIIEESQTPTIYCKKVLKAHQTKGFWVNTTSNTTPTLLPLSSGSGGNSTIVKTPTTTINSGVLPITTISPTSLDVQQQQATTQPAFLMGPPAHMANSVSTSPLAVLSDHSGQTSGNNFINSSIGPRVASRNILLLRAKRQMAMAKAAAAVASTTTTTPITTSGGNVVEEAAELPENLGLPRERVISICNMDKHELDDYFLPEQEEEEESQEDQDTELLQYFQTGDAEEKLNDSLDANKKNPTAATVAVAVSATSTTRTTIMNINSNNKMNEENTTNILPQYSVINDKERQQQKSQQSQEQQKEKEEEELFNIDSMTTNATESIEKVVNKTSTTTTTLIKPTVGSASASLALLSRKHQLKQQEQEYKRITCIDDEKNIKNKQLKVYLNNSNNNISNNNNNNNNNINSDNCYFVNGRNKNRIFVPISPNLATTHPPKQLDVFASPKLSSRLLFKQQSLNTDDSSDPMIGACRRKRSFNSMTTSASAPPSPSLLQQQQQEQQKRRQFNQSVDWMQQHHQNNATTTATTDTQTTASLLNQNSLDFDLFEVNNELQVQQLEQNLSNTLFDIDAQRSQSVPVTQQQRILSPLTKKVISTYYGATVDEQQQQESTSTDIIASTTSSLLDDVDYSVMLPSPEFMSKFDCLTQSAKTAVTSTAYCSSSTSSSGYSSSAYSCNISRSVPSTPLPMQLNLFDSYNTQRKLQNSPITGVVENESFPFGQMTSSMTDTIHTDNIKNGGAGSSLLNYTHDFSKSMPTTPITTHCFRYSPSEFSRDFLLNGNTLDSFNQISGSDVTMVNDNKNSYVSVGVNVDSLINDDSVNLDTLCNNNSNTNDVNVIFRGTALLDDV